MPTYKGPLHIFTYNALLIEIYNYTDQDNGIILMKKKQSTSHTYTFSLWPEQWYNIDEEKNIAHLIQWYNIDEEKNIAHIIQWYNIDEEKTIAHLIQWYNIDEEKTIAHLIQWYYIDEENTLHISYIHFLSMTGTMV